jgi:hypothetical protein
MNFSLDVDSRKPYKEGGSWDVFSCNLTPFLSWMNFSLIVIGENYLEKNVTLGMYLNHYEKYN